MAFTLDHIGVVVRDLDEALAQFSSVFGWSAAGPAEQLGHLGVAVAYLERDDAGPLVQFVAPSSTGPLREFLDDRGEGIHHLCFAVDDIYAAVALLAPGSDAKIIRGGRGRLACFLPAPVAGIRIELTETRRSFGGEDGTA